MPSRERRRLAVSRLRAYAAKTPRERNPEPAQPRLAAQVRRTTDPVSGHTEMPVTA
ncbi:MAG: hypothetical protein IH859_06865 [Chloroflexi bacterium]|nr:hypothetical protein [Chloroflexota bacterium]